MNRIFWVTCPTCAKAFSVDYGIRFVDVALECPWCRGKFKVDEASAIDERWLAGG
ncbi:MAG: hypothetical protein QOG54_1374 [Actinomycetota bacterium]|jgi:uncharacterized protein YbaR (Trm112 family)|nr:hypothetical protein [Actinomycetota bacterium]